MNEFDKYVDGFVTSTPTLLHPEFFSVIWCFSNLVFFRDMYGLKSDPRSGFFFAEKLTVRSGADIRTCKNRRIITERNFRLDNDTDRSGAGYPY